METLDSIWRTNPVKELESHLEELECDWTQWSLKGPAFKRVVAELVKSRVHLPQYFLERMVNAGLSTPNEKSELSSEAPRGVCGLLVDTDTGVGLVTRLHATIHDSGNANNWAISPNLPFDNKCMQRIFVDLAQVLDLPPSTPERLSFQISDELGKSAEGRSMDIAGLLAILRELNGDPTLLSAACSLVEPMGKQDLQSVGFFEIKLKAFIREYGHGSLMIRHADTSPEFDECFDEVWIVDKLKGLALYLQKSGLLDALFTRTVLTSQDVRVINRLLHELIEVAHDYNYAIDLANRSLLCETDASQNELTELRRYLLNAERHCGCADVNSKEAEELERLKQFGQNASYTELLDATNLYAAAHYDPHRFEEIVEILFPWIERVNSDPQVFSVDSRYCLYNTLGRAYVALRRAGWEELYRRSLELQVARCPEQMQRTRNYLIHALLDNGRLDEARNEIVLALADPFLEPMSKLFLTFYQAELARQDGRIWVDELIERSSAQLGYIHGFYYQATARQVGRTLDDRQRRFELSERGFRESMRSNSTNSVLVFLAHLARLGATVFDSDSAGWKDALEILKSGLTTGEANYYREELNKMGPVPDADAAERLFEKVAYF